MPWTSRKTTRELGQQTEESAASYLANQGLHLQAKNFHSRQGEIDLIMREGNTCVFVEVKYRKSAKYGDSSEMVSYQKQQKIRQCAAFYLQQQGLNEYNTECRFDVVALQGDINHPKITWLKNAF